MERQHAEAASLSHQVGDFVMALQGAGFCLESIGEHTPNAQFAARYTRAEKYVGWPMLLWQALRAVADAGPD